jgi:hypothetical protein
MLEVIDVLTAESVPYLLVGSFSSNFYGVPRSTKDVDIVVELGEQSIHRIAYHLSPRYRLQPQIAFESVTGTTRHVIEVLETPFQVELFRVSNDEHDRGRFARRVQVTWLDRQVWLPTPEDVIITKLRWLSHLHRNKDYDDVLTVAAVQRGRLDWQYMELWADKHGTRVILDKLRSEIPVV